MLRVWNLSLLCATFSLTILGTFLTRSGVLNSVHSFSASTVGPLLLGFFALIVVVTVGLIAWRGDRLRAPGRIDSPVSREGAFLANNLLFAAFAFVVLLGTVFPLIVEAVNGNRLSVGAPYFNRMTMPIGVALLFIMAVAPALPWRKASMETLSQRLLWPAWGAVGTVVVAVALGARGLVPLVAFALAAFAAGASLRQLVLATRRQGWRGLVGRTNGGMIVHLGVIMIAVTVAANSSYTREAEVRLAPGQRRTVAGHTVEFVSFRERATKAAFAREALVRVDGGRIYTPALKKFANSVQEVGTPSVRSGLTENVFLALREPPRGPGGTILLRVIVQPLIVWLWTGGAVIFGGSFLAAFPGRRRRRGTDPASAPVPTGTSPPLDPDPDPEPEPVLAGSAP